MEGPGLPIIKEKCGKVLTSEEQLVNLETQSVKSEYSGQTMYESLTDFVSLQE